MSGDEEQAAEPLPDPQEVFGEGDKTVSAGDTTVCQLPAPSRLNTNSTVARITSGNAHNHSGLMKWKSANIELSSAGPPQ